MASNMFPLAGCKWECVCVCVCVCVCTCVCARMGLTWLLLFPLLNIWLIENEVDENADEGLDEPPAKKSKLSKVCRHTHTHTLSFNQF